MGVWGKAIVKFALHAPSEWLGPLIQRPMAIIWVSVVVRAQETHTLCVFDQLPVVSWRRAKYKQMYGLKSTLTVSR